MMTNERSNINEQLPLMASTTAAAVTSTTTTASSPTNSTAMSAKAILLKHGLMPDYRHVHRSEELLENYLVRKQPSQQEQQPPQQQQQQQQPQSILELPPSSSEQIVILHSLFDNFCVPPPSLESVAHCFLLEQGRVAALNKLNNEKGGDSRGGEFELYPQNQQSQQSFLPRETIIQTTSSSTSCSSAAHIINLLKSEPASCLLTLPIEFQLTFFRLLVRLLSGVDDDEYDDECLFDWNCFMNGNCEGQDGEGNESISNNQTQGNNNDNPSYDYIRKSSIQSHSNPRDRTLSTSSLKSQQPTNNNNRDRTFSSSSHHSQTYHRKSSYSGDTTKAFDTWSFGRWNRKKSSAPLYSVVRFCESLLWKERCGDSHIGVGSESFGNNENLRKRGSARRSLKWSFVADNVKLTPEEEEALRRESLNSSFGSAASNKSDSKRYGNDENGGKDGEMDENEIDDNMCEKEWKGLGEGGDVVGILIRIYRAILAKCMKQQQQLQLQSQQHSSSDSCNDGQYLLLGPVAHLIGLICATKVSVKNLRLLFVMMEDGSLFQSQTTQLQKSSVRSSSTSSCSSLLRKHSSDIAAINATAMTAIQTLARLHILRALRYAAEYSIQFNGMLDKPGPATFFSFGRQKNESGKSARGGLSARFEMPWPFRYDFGMACWFRAESFLPSFDASGDAGGKDGDSQNNRHVVLFSARTQNGARIEVSFESHSVVETNSTTNASGESSSSSSPSSTAATLIVTVMDATASSNSNNSSSDSTSKARSIRKVRLVGCVLSPSVWYHVAVRLSRPSSRLSRFSLAQLAFSGNKDEVSIFLNGKLMLKEHMKMPQFVVPPNSSGESSGSGKGMMSSGLASIGAGFGSLTGSTGSNGHHGESTAALKQKKMPLEISFFGNLDGQAGSLYVFKDHVSEESIGALYRETMSHTFSSSAEGLHHHHHHGDASSSRLSHSSSHFGTFVDRWDTGHHGKLHALTKAVSSASMHSDDLSDVVLPNYTIFTGEQHQHQQREGTRNRNRNVLFDLVEEDGNNNVDSEHVRPALNKSNFGSKLLLVWDPRRITTSSNGVLLLDPHMGAHIIQTTNDPGGGGMMHHQHQQQLSTFSFESIRDTIESLGGISRLLPLFGMLNTTLNVGKKQPPSSGSGAQQHVVSKGIVEDYHNMVIPSLLFLVASFIREHEANACELYRCGGIHVIEKLLHDCKKRDVDSSSYYRLGVSSTIARHNASALLDLWQASRLNFALETSVFSRLIFNVPLLLGGGVAKSRGKMFQAVILPVLSEICMMNPDKVRDCVEVGELFEVINEYSFGESSCEEEMARRDSLAEEEDDCLFCESTTSTESTLTNAERAFVVDTLLGMIVMMLSQQCDTKDLTPLLTFITYNLDLEWEEASKFPENKNIDGGDHPPTVKRHSNRYFTTVKAVSILFFLLQKSNVPHLINSLSDIFENGNCVASWILCCLVNSFDDTIRGLGIKCLAAYLRAINSTTATAASVNINMSSNGNLTVHPSQKLSKTMKRGLEVISHQANNMLSNVLSGRVNIKIVYKLLWHLLKCHRERLGAASNAALMYLIVDDGSNSSVPSSAVPLTDIIVPNNEMLGGFRLSLEELNDRTSSRVVTDSSQSHIRNKYGVSTVMRLLRFLSNDQKERWLFDILAFLLADSQNSIDIILSCDDWQPVLFQLVAEVLEEIYGEDAKEDGAGIDASEKSNGDASSDNNGFEDTVRGSIGSVNTETLSRPSVRTRYDLSLKLYSTLLGHCVRQGDEKAFDAVEMAASLQRVDANGSEIFSILLSHLFADLIENGTVAHVEQAYKESNNADTGGIASGRNRALKQSARLVTQSILSNGADGLDMASAVRQWRTLRHLTALTVAIVTESGFGVVQLFDYRNQDASAVDGITGGMYGIRLDNLVSGVNAFEALAAAKLHAHSTGRHQRDRYRYVCVVLASQVLTLIDAFVFPDNLDTARAASQLHGLALVRSTEPRLGQSQGTLLASLVRLSLVLLAYLEPSSVKFLQACSRLRCFLHWVLEILRESVALGGGYSEAFHELTAPLDRIVLAIVLQCHRALSRCSVVLVEMESSPWQKYFGDIDARQKSLRRLFRAILELREIVLAAYRGRNEVLRAALSPQAHVALSRGLEEVAGGTPKTPNKAGGDFQSKEASLRAFLENDWVSGFHDVEGDGNSLILPEQIANGQVYQGQAASTRGRQAVEELAAESTAMVKEYSALLNAPFTVYCENQRKWAETDAVRDREYEGDVSVKRLSSKHRSDIVDSNKSIAARFVLALQRLTQILRLSNDPWNIRRHWTFASYTDLLYRRMVFHPNYNFDDHVDASYELTLGKERESMKRAEEARKEREMAEEALRAAIVPYKESTDDDVDVEEEDTEKGDKEGFLGWGVEDGGEDSLDQQLHQNGDEDSVTNAYNASADGEDDGNASIDDQSSKKDSIAEESEWDQIEPPTDFDSSNELDDPLAWARKFMWAEGEHFVHSFESVVIVSIQNTREGTLLLTSQSIYFHQTGDTIDVMTKEKMAESGDGRDGGAGPSKQDKKWKLNRLTDVHGRRYMLKAQALELFFANMEGLFLTFHGTKERDLFHAKLRGNCKVPLLRSFKSLNPRAVFKKSKLTDLWRKRKISNFQYIMALNLMAGRTFNDITQYPVFPWILADYTSETLDLNDPAVYRDLSKPVGALNPDRLEQLIDRYHDLDGFPEEEKFLYGSHYSSPGVVLHYLIRQEPYTSMHIALQSGRFDCPDRLFFDMGGCWRSCNTSTSDVKELLPEFFTCPEIFMNTNHFPLGETQTKMSIDSVKLPPWANGSPHEFIRLHRLALESDYVSNNLHHWIDLIFGHKQRGPAALAANNVFHYLSYEGSVDIDKVTDELERKAIEGHIQNFGQTPSQLIAKEPHPSRSLHDEEPKPLFQDVRLENMRCDTPKKQFGGPKKAVAGAIISLQAIGDSILAIHSDFTLCSYKLHSYARGSVPFHFKIDRARRLGSRNASIFQKNLPKTSEVTEFDSKVSFAIALGVNSRSSGTGNSSSDLSHLLMSCGYFDDCLKIHSLDTLQLQCSLNGGHRGQITCLEVGDEGEMMVTGGNDATCRIWIVDHDALAAAITDGSVKSSQSEEASRETKCHQVHTLLGHVTPVSCVAICTKLDIVVSGSQSGSICLHNVRSGKFIRSLHIDAITKEVEESCTGNGFPVRNLAIHMDGSFAAHHGDGSLHVISINGEQLCSTHIGEQLNAMIICPKSETLITGGISGRVRIWKLHDLSLQCTVDVKNGPITSLAFSNNDPQLLCIGSNNGMLSIVSRIP